MERTVSCSAWPQKMCSPFWLATGNLHSPGLSKNNGRGVAWVSNDGSFTTGIVDSRGPAKGGGAGNTPSHSARAVMQIRGFALGSRGGGLPINRGSPLCLARAMAPAMTPVVSPRRLAILGLR
jgi:hypothetical protein